MVLLPSSPKSRLRLFAALASVCLEASDLLANGVREPLRPAKAVEYELPWSVESEGFNLAADVHALDGILFGFNYIDPDNHYCLEFQPAKVLLIKVECGLMRPLATGDLLGGGQPLLLKRRRSAIELFEGSRRCLKFFDSTFQGGRAGFAGKNLESAFKSPPRLQHVAPIFFADDFMRGESELGEWTVLAGDWKIKSLKNPLRSANAFKYMAHATRGPALTVTGYWFWENYEFQAAFQGAGNEAAGLLFGYQDEQHFFRFAWTGASQPDGGSAQLVLRAHGHDQVLWKQNFGYQQGQWYQLKVALEEDRARLSIDEVELGEVALPCSAHGKAGLLTESAVDETLFDDVLIRTVQDYRADFSDLDRGRWQILAGRWKPGENSCHAESPEPALAVTGNPEWHDYSVETRVTTAPAASAGLVFLFQDPGDCCLFLVDTADRKAKLLRFRGGHQETLAETDLRLPHGTKTFHLSAAMDRQVISAFLDGKLVLQAVDASINAGRAGLWSRGSSSLFSQFAVRFSPIERKPIGCHNQIFTHEVSMGNWATVEGDWITQSNTVDGLARTAAWHRLDMPGAVELRVPIPPLPAKNSQNSPAPASVSLFLGAQDPLPDSGYALELHSGPGLRLELRRAGRLLAQRLLEDSISPQSLRLRLEESLVLAYLNGQIVMTVPANTPLSGGRVGWSACGLHLDPARIQVFSQQVITNSFDTAPTDWIASEGLWQVSNRWQCDPRWSFFSGKLLERKRPVVIWNKRIIEPGCLTVELTLGQKMQRELGSSYDDYVRDYNLTLCADGKDLRTGYSFVLGGWSNTRTAIVRGAQVVAETSKPLIDAGGLHLKWYILKAQVNEGQVSFYVDDQRVLSYRDPTPLTGTRLAVWSYDNSVILPRVRISCRGPAARSHPAIPTPRQCPTFYDESPER